MKSILAAIIAFFASAVSDARAQAPTVEGIRKLPEKLRVSHAPNRVAAVRNGRSGRAFTWEFQTSVAATDKEITIIEFGCFQERDGKWVFSNYTGKPFTGRDFAEWYSCPRARLRLGSPARDPQNWIGDDQLRPAKALWYFIGVDPAGKRCRGEAVVEQLGRLGT